MKIKKWYLYFGVLVIGILCFLIIHMLTGEKNIDENVQESIEESVVLSFHNDAEKDILYLEWNHISNVEQYDLYRKVDENWDLIYTDVSKNSIGKYKDKGIMESDRLEYVIRYMVNDHERESNYVSVEIPMTPYGMKISNMTNEGIEYYWKEPEGVSGYEIYRRHGKEGDWTFLGERKRKEDTFLDSTFSKDANKIFYKIRSFIENDGVRIYSKFSEATEAEKKKNLELEEKIFYLRTGDYRKLTAYYEWGEGYDLQWKSSDNDIVQVDEHGVITGMSAGECTITCRGTSFNDEVSCRVVVDRKADDKLAEYDSVYRKKITEAGTIWKMKRSSGKGENISIAITGDMMCTGAQQEVQGYKTGNYNFNGSYKCVKEIIEDADLAMGNLETVLSSTWPYMHEEAYVNNKANCNAPSRYLDAIKYAGFDAVVMSNNHNCDSGVQGLIETIAQVERYDLARTGVFKGEYDQRGMLIDTKGIKIGVLSYTTRETGFNKKDLLWSENDVNEKLNYYEKEKAIQDIEDLRSQGAEYIIVYMHWGVKNHYEVTESQRHDAQELASIGADYIVGAHAHVLQEYEVIEYEGKRVPCFYSLGDFQASIDQIEGNRDSVILMLELKKNEAGEVELVNENYIPCHTLTKYKGDYYVTIPLQEENRELFSDYDIIIARIADFAGNKISVK